MENSNLLHFIFLFSDDIDVNFLIDLLKAERKKLVQIEVKCVLHLFKLPFLKLSGNFLALNCSHSANRIKFLSNTFYLQVF